MLGIVISGIAADALRTPDHQLTGRIYVASVHAYQREGSPLLEGYVRCRFRPTCSHYSAAAVQKYGVAKGLALTASRLWRCQRNVPLGTVDEVP